MLNNDANFSFFEKNKKDDKNYSNYFSSNCSNDLDKNLESIKELLASEEEEEEDKIYRYVSFFYRIKSEKPLGIVYRDRHEYFFTTFIPIIYKINDKEAQSITFDTMAKFFDTCPDIKSVIPNEFITMFIEIVLGRCECCPLGVSTAKKILIKLFGYQFEAIPIPLIHEIIEENEKNVENVSLFLSSITNILEDDPENEYCMQSLEKCIQMSINVIKKSVLMQDYTQYICSIFDSFLKIIRIEGVYDCMVSNDIKSVISPLLINSQYIESSGPFFEAYFASEEVDPELVFLIIHKILELLNEIVEKDPRKRISCIKGVNVQLRLLALIAEKFPVESVPQIFEEISKNGVLLLLSKAGLYVFDLIKYVTAVLKTFNDITIPSEVVINFAECLYIDDEEDLFITLQFFDVFLKVYSTRDVFGDVKIMVSEYHNALEALTSNENEDIKNIAGEILTLIQ